MTRLTGEAAPARRIVQTESWDRTIARTFTSSEACSMTGCSLRHLQYWDEHGVISPPQRSHSRRYSTEDIVRLRAVLHFRKVGISLEMIRKAVRRDGFAAARFILLDKHGCVKFAHTSEGVVDVLLRAKRPLALFDAGAEGPSR